MAPFREMENKHLMFICICILAAAYIIISRGLKSALSFLFLKKEPNKSLLFMNLYRIALVGWGCGGKLAPGCKMTVVVVIVCVCVC